ncbi:DUF317 domain-containing protein [Streptomyces sp. NPDC056716]|uniref:DUF317 domain-containing protein n=1 Tax=unclassified Streptomyces TaxID=2593676 RepID=UPI0036A8B34B
MTPDETVLDTEVRIAPRYLAGPAGTDVRAAWPFPFESGWRLHQDTEGDAVAASPDLNLRAGYRPEFSDFYGRGGGSWRLDLHDYPFDPPLWSVHLGGAVPTEILHDVNAEVLSLYLDALHSDDIRAVADGTSPVTGYLPLLTAGWSQEINPDGHQFFNSPDLLASLRHQYKRGGRSDDALWSLTVRIPGQEALWRATFTRRVPIEVVTALTSALVDPQPLTRRSGDLPFHVREHFNRSGQPVRTAPAPSALPPPSPAAPATHRTR